VKKTYQLGNQQVQGEEVEFEPERESFNVYILQDGTKLKLKTVVATIIRLEAFNPMGEPMYMVNASQILAADVPDSLKRKS
jgi:hypothetical protein